MEQIYYTQCPVGYGLGASNGYQIKRLSPGYPTSGDFRHLGLRAFPGGGRTLAPATLRYRLEGPVAEVVHLAPRSHEYDTERGLWGRPGGVFAHGLRLDPAELASIRRWPAGLLDSPGWIRTDREPTRGQPPQVLELSPNSLPIPADFSGLARLAESFDPERLARLLQATAAATREGRTLFLIDEPSRLGPTIALLTLAFPEVLRGDLTFSTFHDRPDELPGYRIQGTTPACRPNRGALASLGIVADLTTGTFEPAVEPAEWATTLAGWITRRDPIDESDWSETDVRARSARLPEGPAALWSDGWLDPLFGFPSAYRDRIPPQGPDGWERLARFAWWAGPAGSGEEWLRPRGPEWWEVVPEEARRLTEARHALIGHARLRDAWKEDPGLATAWGRVVGLWFRDASPMNRDNAIAAVLRSAPRAARPAFAQALLRELTPDGASAFLDRLRADFPGDRATLLPLEAGAAVSALLQGAEPDAIRRVVEEALGHPGAITAVLDAAEGILGDRPEARGEVARATAGAFDFDGPGRGKEATVWALRRGSDAATWLSPALRPLLADSARADAWLLLAGRVPEAMRLDFTRAFLTIAAGPGLPDEAFRWGIENLLLPLAPRPHDPTWAETYLIKIPSDLDLILRLFSPEATRRGVFDWIRQARGMGEVSDIQSARVDNSRAYVRALKSGDLQELGRIEVPAVPEHERGKLLAQMLQRVEGPELAALPFVLEAVRRAWPQAFDPGAHGLRALAAPLARILAPLWLVPQDWLERVLAIVERLGVGGGPLEGFEPSGLAAEMAAVSATFPDRDPWKLRQYLLDHDRGWRLLYADVRRDLESRPIASAVEVFEEWDRKLTKRIPGRFHEAFLNAADGFRLAAVASLKASELRSLPALSWWVRDAHPGSTDDLRDAFARLAPIAPLAEGRLAILRPWVEPKGSSAVSTLGQSRLKAIEALTHFQQVGDDPSARWRMVLDWRGSLPLGDLGEDDRHRFIAWLILGISEAEPDQMEAMAEWLFDSGLADVSRLTRWGDDLQGLVEVDGQARLFRVRLVDGLKARLRTLVEEDRSRKARPKAGGNR